MAERSVQIVNKHGLHARPAAEMVKAASRFIEEHPGAQIELELMGRKGRDFFRRRDLPA